MERETIAIPVKVVRDEDAPAEGSKVKTFTVETVGKASVDEEVAVPNKTIYIREADAEVWEKAEKLAGGSVSSLIAEALRRYVEEEERKEQGGMEDIRIELWGGGEEQNRYDAEFVGEWLLIPDEDETRTGEPGYDAGAYWGVALTRRGNIAVYVQHVNEGFAPVLDTYDSLQEAEDEGVPSDILAMAASAMGADYVRKLDI